MPGRPVQQTLILLTIAILAWSTGCATIRVTDPYRTATEQFLETEASRLAISNIATDALRDRKVFVDPTYLTNVSQAAGAVFVSKETSPENLFVLGELRSHLLNHGARLVEKKEEAEIIMEVRTGGIGVDRTEFLLGIPGLSLSFNVTANVPVTTPELAIIKSTKQHGFASVAYVAYWRDTGEIVASSGPFVGRTIREDYWILGTGPRTIGNIAPAETVRATSQPSK